MIDYNQLEEYNIQIAHVTFPNIPTKYLRLYLLNTCIFFKLFIPSETCQIISK